MRVGGVFEDSGWPLDRVMRLLMGLCVSKMHEEPQALFDSPSDTSLTFTGQ